MRLRDNQIIGRNWTPDNATRLNEDSSSTGSQGRLRILADRASLSTLENNRAGKPGTHWISSPETCRCRFTGDLAQIPSPQTHQLPTTRSDSTRPIAMVQLSSHDAAKVLSPKRLLTAIIVIGSLLQPTACSAFPRVQRSWQAKFFSATTKSSPAKRGPPLDTWDGKIPLVITNRCEGTIWPGLATQAGTGPGTGGFQLASGASKQLWVSGDWQGRVWGRTNCTVNGDSCTCTTGDCMGKLDCQYSVREDCSFASG